LAVMCDQGRAEDYLNENFDQIADRVLELVRSSMERMKP